MIFLYTIVLLLLVALKVVVARRAASLERKYSTVAQAVLKRTYEPAFKLGNSGREDLSVAAKRMLELGVLVQKRDILEGRYYWWRAWADKLGRLVGRMRAWKGKKLPYTMGAIDVWLVLYAIDRFGVFQFLSPRQLLDSIRAWLGW